MVGLNRTPMKASYILGAGLIAIKVSGAKKYYITDALGSVLALTDSSGNVTDTYEYEPFGELVVSTGSSYNPYRFTGQQYDSDSGLYYLRTRYYDISTGRFISRDSISEILHIYVYANNNPVIYIDPSGKINVVTIAVCVAAVIATIWDLSVLGKIPGLVEKSSKMRKELDNCPDQIRKSVLEDDLKEISRELHDAIGLGLPGAALAMTLTVGCIGLIVLLR